MVVSGRQHRGRGVRLLRQRQQPVDLALSPELLAHLDVVAVAQEVRGREHPPPLDGAERLPPRHPGVGEVLARVALQVVGHCMFG